MASIIKPRGLGIATRSMPKKDGGSFVISIYGLAALDVSDPDRLLAEEGLWPLLMEELPEGRPWDTGMPKPWGEYLIGGHAMANDGQPTASVSLLARVGDDSRQFTVFGDRYWMPSARGFVQSEPVPFDKLKIEPSRAFGGAGFSPNPQGQGFNAPARLARGEPVALPNVEWGHQLIRSVDDRPDPVVMGPVDVMDPERMKLAGTYDDQWLKHVSPGLPADVDPRLFCMAPQTQWRSGFWRGDETFEFAGFWKRPGRLSGRLPAFHARAFLAFTANPKQVLEATTRLDTIVFLPSVAKAVLAWRTVVATQHPDGNDVAAVMIGYDRLDAPRPHEHYQQVYALRSDPEGAARYAFSEHQLAPVMGEARVNKRLARRRAAREQEMERRRRAQAIMLADTYNAAGIPEELRLDPPDVEPLPAFLPTPEDIESGEFDLADLIDGADQLMQKTMAEMDEMERSQQPLLAAAQAFQASPKADTLDALLAQLESDGEPLPRTADITKPLRETAETLSGPAQDEARAKVAQLLEQFETGLPVAAADDDDALFQKARARFLQESAGPLDDALKALDELPSQWIDDQTREEIAKHPFPEPSPTPSMLDMLADAAKLSPEAAPDLVKARASLEKADADFGKHLPKLGKGPDGTHMGALMGLSLGPADNKPAPRSIAEVEASLTEAVAKAREQIAAARTPSDSGMADVRRISPEPMFPMDAMGPAVAARFGAFIVEALVQGQAMAGRDCAGAILSEADFSGLDLSGAMFERADLRGARFAGAICKDAVFTGAILDGADFTAADLTNANLSGASAIGTCFRQATAQGVSAIKLRAPQANFSQAKLGDIIMNEASLTGAVFDNAVLTRLIITNTDLSAVRARGASLEQVTCLESRMGQVDLSGVRARQCAFVNVQADGLDLSEAMLEACAFLGETTMTEARLRDASIKTSTFRQRNLDGAVLRGAVASRVDFGECQLNGADCRLATLHSCLFSGAQLTGLRAFGANAYGAVFRDADLTGGNWRFANLFGADFTGAILIAVDLEGAHLQRSIMALASDATE